MGDHDIAPGQQRNFVVRHVDGMSEEALRIQTSCLLQAGQRTIAISRDGKVIVVNGFTYVQMDPNPMSLGDSDCRSRKFGPTVLIAWSPTIAFIEPRDLSNVTRKRSVSRSQHEQSAHHPGP